MNKQQKFRMKSWYWGNYCVQLENGRYLDNTGNFMSEGTYFCPIDLEPYIEEEHGWHNSEEHRLKGEDFAGRKLD